MLEILKMKTLFVLIIKVKRMPNFEAQKMNIFVLMDIVDMKMYISPKVW